MAHNEQNFYVEERPDGTFAASRGGAERASFLGKTQAEAAEKAHASDPTADVFGERVRHTNVGSPDKWRLLFRGHRK